MKLTRRWERWELEQASKWRELIIITIWNRGWSIVIAHYMAGLLHACHFKQCHYFSLAFAIFHIDIFWSRGIESHRYSFIMKGNRFSYQHSNFRRIIHEMWSMTRAGVICQCNIKWQCQQSQAALKQYVVLCQRIWVPPPTRSESSSMQVKLFHCADIRLLGDAWRSFKNIGESVIGDASAIHQSGGK